MKIRLNPNSVEQLIWIMEKTGNTNPTFTIQKMISTIYNNLNKNANKHTSPVREDNNHGQASKNM